jgi:putative ABC transport system ATP-binding protein
MATVDHTAALDLRGVVKRYPGGVEALRGVSMHVERGELVAIVGPSGSGKTTLLQIMGTLDRPTEGRVVVDGYDVSLASDNELSALRANCVGFVFQQFHLLDGMSAIDNVASGMLYNGVPLRERRVRAREALVRVGLGHRLDHRPDQLSGGEKQRTAIARAIIGHPEIIFADEPTGALDTQAGHGVIDLMMDLNRDDGATLIIITHDPDLAASLPRQVQMLDGEVVYDSGVQEAVAT